MKKTLFTLASVLFCAITFAQSVPQGINYQAVARDANGDELTNQFLTVAISIISNSATGTIQWKEGHYVNTNDSNEKLLSEHDVANQSKRTAAIRVGV